MCLDEVLGKYKAPAIAVNVPAESVSSKVSDTRIRLIVTHLVN